MKKQQRLTRTIAAGALALALAIPAGAASASNGSQTADSAARNAGYLQIDLNALLQQYMQGKYGSGKYPGIKFPSYDGSGQTYTPPQPGAGTGSGTGTGAGQPTQPTQPAQPASPTQPAAAVSEYAAQVVALVNKERVAAGLQALDTANATLTKMALDKAKDIYNNNYFDHNSPTYGSPFDMMKQYGISYRYAGENIAKGQRTPQEVVTAWMNSPGHKANILNANFTTIGVGYYNNVWVQEFIG